MSNQDNKSGWRPSASHEALHGRARLLARIRAYFAEAGVLEVETPLLSRAAVTDPNLESIATAPSALGEPQHYLNTSPEFAMKRLLAAGSGAIYQICKAFRAGEAGRLHNPEFTLLEWYRPGFDHHRLMDEVAELVKYLAPQQDEFSAMEKLTYAGCFQTCLGIDPLTVTVSELLACARAHGLGEVGLDTDDRDGWLDLLMSHAIQPQLGRGKLTFVHDYPASQAALARLLPDDKRVAARFELFMAGVEIANGFHELRDPREQRARFEADLHKRRQQGQAVVPMDENLLAALQAGLPDCAGVALGLDRLQMVLMGANSLKAVIAFTVDHA
jgi:lysyl-tRNA synthetase class 2